MSTYDENGVRIGEPSLFDIATPKFSRINETVSPVVTAVGNRVDFVGSCVGIQLGDARFVLTAAHVADHRHDSPLYSYGVTGLTPLSGEVTRVFSSTNRREDNIDLAAYRLSSEMARNWPDNFFAGPTELDLTISPPYKHSYLVSGYPASRNKRARSGTSLRSATYQFGALDAERSEYASEGLRSTQHVLLGFEKEAMHGANGKSVAPDMYGMSGSGAWRVGRRLRNANGRPLLSAILTEWRRDSVRPHLIGTRITVAISALVERYPELLNHVA